MSSRFARPRDNDDDRGGMDENYEARVNAARFNDNLDVRFGYNKHTEMTEKVGWMVNMQPAEVIDEEKRLVSAMDYYFIQEDGGRFKVSIPYQPYFFVRATAGSEQDVCTFLSKKFSGQCMTVEQVSKEDLDLQNHLIGLQQTYIKLSFLTSGDMMKVKKFVMSAVNKNKTKDEQQDMYREMMAPVNAANTNYGPKVLTDHSVHLLDLREYDVPYNVRANIDKDLFVAHWYSVVGQGQDDPILTKRPDIIDPPDPVVLAYDIETTKLPLKFPDSTIDSIMMISYMVDGQGYLITNREVISADIDDFEYTPRPEFDGPFIIMNEKDEKSLIVRFFEHIQELAPNVIVTYNGDYFDMPYVSARSEFHGLNMYEEIGFKEVAGAWISRHCSHLDAFYWVQRDSYLPIGSQNLKAVAKAKLRYDPVEMDPEDMCRMAAEQPQVMSTYSVSDAVATYYLYMKYVHPFTFALCTILPMPPDEVLRKGSGTLCEALLMVQAYKENIIFPNKQRAELNKMTDDGHLLEAETYVGGHVEALESGVFRADIPIKFRVTPSAFQTLIDDLEETMKFSIEQEEKVPMEYVTNFAEVIEEIKKILSDLRDTPNRLEKPMIYHLDVGAMYPNIILTNRLQPSALIDEVTCAACDFNKPGAKCQRTMEWKWRGDFSPASRAEYHSIKHQLESEKVPGKAPGEPARSFHELAPQERAEVEKKRLNEYCKRAYRKTKITKTESRKSTICQREHPFYINTVKSFRDRRYEYKALNKQAGKKHAEAVKKGDPVEIKRMGGQVVLYDSLQLAHKCILNSFYGYVMRRGARWYSMEMAGIVCYTGANIITKAREIVEQIGRPLELDTDGIWCCLPGCFPENYEIKTNHPDPRKQKVTISYPGAMLNVMVYKHFTNDQYHDLEDPKTLRYSIKSENSIFFEVDGPYLAMILPAAKEEGKKLKKRYAVFNFDGSLAELKGFELKRRGELQLIKNFQSSVFSAFLEGTTLKDVYAAVAKVADYWLDILYSQAENMPDEELFDLISSTRNMSRKLEEYGEQKSTSISTAKRIAEFLGDQMTKEKGLNCKFIITRKPDGSPVTERAIPVAIFQAEPAVKRYYLRRWLKCPSLVDFDIRDILDWDYYKERFGSAIMKIITIPAALQGVSNPVPRVQHPDWLYKMVAEKNDVFQQKKITDMFGKAVKKPLASNTSENIPDIEDVGGPKKPTLKPVIVSKQATAPANKRQLTEEKIPTHWKEELGEPPIFKEGLAQFQSWLSFHKQKWKIQNKIRKHNASAKVSAFGSTEPSRKTGGARTMDNFVRQGQQSILKSIWQVIQVVPLGTPGLFRLWVSIDGNIQQLRVTVPRIFYVNCRTPKDKEKGELWRKTSKILPRSAPLLNLYEYTVPEDVFQQHAGEISTELAGPDVEGVYETNVPPLFRILVQLGCACAVNPEHARFRTLTNDSSDMFELQNLQFRSEAEVSYLSNVEYLYLYEINSGTRNIISILSRAEHKGTIFVSDSSKVNSVGNLGNHYRSIYPQESEGLSERYIPPDDMRFEVRVEDSMKTTARAVHRYLTDYRDRHKSLVILLQTLDQTNMQVPAITSCPVVKVPFDSADSLAMLDWQRHASRKILSNFFSSLKWLEHNTTYSRYVHVPIGNVSVDLSILGGDVFYARHLLKQNHVLWANTAPFPDLGGKEEDDHRLMGTSEQEHVLSLNFPAAYNTACVEINLEGLAVNTILHSHHVNDIEGVSTVSLDTINQQVGINKGEGSVTVTAYDEAAQVNPAFKVLKTMVIGWLHQVSSANNQYADTQLIHFYRWLTSSSSLLHDPALARVVNSSIKKLFLQLIMEVRKLGSTIVYCDMNRIVVATKKRTVEDALNYVEYIVNSITSQELFGCIGLQVTKSWENLLWLDAVNYGGALKNSGDLAPTIHMNWNLKKFLPEDGSIQKFFQLIIAGYIQAVNKMISESVEDHVPGETPIRRASQKTDSLDKSALQEFVADKLVTQLYSIVQRIHSNMPSNMLGDRDVFPKLPGSHLELKNPALEFIKSVCKILSLDSTITSQVTKLKKDLLRLVQVGEFSEASIFKDPCLSFVLAEVICKKCSNCRDVDLCRDPYLEAGPPPVWLCAHCSTPYDRDLIEETLVRHLQERLLQHTLQDVVCCKCSAVKNTNMAEYCTCAGGFAPLHHLTDLEKVLSVLGSIAQHFHLTLLQGMVEWSRDQIRVPSTDK